MADTVTTAPYGTWESPIASEHLSGDSVHFEGVLTNESTGQIYAIESRPSEGGRHVLVDLSDANFGKDVLPAEYNVMGSIHEYGGGVVAMHPDGRIFFTSHPNNGIYLLDPASGKVDTIVTRNPAVRLGDFHVEPASHEWILAVQESHHGEGADSVENTVVAIHVPTGQVSTVLNGADFYEHPQFSPDAKRICWTQWDHPDMPWTGSQLYVSEWDESTGAVGERTLVSGQTGVESICQPRWGVDGTLIYVSDKSGYWQLYRYDGKVSTHIHLKGLEMAEFGSREPSLNNCTYVQLDRNTLVASANKNATSNLISIDLTTSSWTDLGLPLVDIQKNATARISSTSFAVIGNTRTMPQALYRVDLTDNNKKAVITLLKRTLQNDLPQSIIGQAQHITFPQIYGNGKATGGSAHAWFISPKNDAYKAPDGTKPPLLVWMHGGPTYHVPPGLSLNFQYWSSRGYAYVMVNHVGSTSYGRAYRSLLNGNWGSADIDDAASCVAYLRAQGLVDNTRVGIVGESAGGYAVLQALYLYPDLWTAGISIYGISSLAEFAADTHKFESRYIDSLVLGTKVGKTDEEIDQIYKARSALFHLDKITAPLLLLQGDSDTIVPAWQSTKMEEKMRELGKPVEMTIFEGEGHGFHLAETIKKSTELQEAFWAKAFF
ncbi:hypothetical protein SEUCBS140593_007776 [Sporothrix eucalyptigena]|uniref:Peptidase S9 prolyl oligopeptidase catalytic domain-containing protein n=1 Tax=Sporothrix eucalyptigena TaxID=1812306 RepID=A0ABP0CGF3_9PEZI